MASRGSSDPQARPDAGDTLIVIPRSSDELSLAKGDRVELIERDDEFGDGWFLGRHLVNGNTGLFPEGWPPDGPLYTRPAPRAAQAFTPSKPLAPVAEVHHDPGSAGVANASPKPTQISEPSPSPPVVKTNDASVTLPLNSVKSDPTVASALAGTSSPPVVLGRLDNRSQDSQVLNDTLNVINEHITDLRSPSSNGALQAAATDSGSEYSAPLDQRMSYIQGEETDEEEDGAHTRAEVEAWTADDVSEYLFIAGVEKHHCEVFKVQEISGEVLLGMDQTSLFIKAFDLGSVGRRLKTWHKIKALQDEVSTQGQATRRTTQTYGSEVGSEDAMRTRSRTNTLTTSISNRPMSVQTRRLSSTQTPKPSPTTLNTPISPYTVQDSPTRPGHTKRPSAASVRELHHSRLHSSTDFRLSGSAPGGLVPALNTNGTNAGAEATHRKQPSFDRNWTLGSAFSQPTPRPLSSAGLQDAVANSDPDLLQDSAVDLDRGYFSGTEADGRKRNVLRKRDSVAHSRKSSYTEEQRVRSAAALSRHSRFGSVDSFRDGAPSPAMQKYYGIQPTPHRRTASTNTAESVRPIPPAKDAPSPTVTNLDTGSVSGRQTSPTSTKHSGFNSDWFAAVVNRPMGKARPGMRAISDRLTSNRSKDIATPDLQLKDTPLDSPARTGSSTPSVGASLDLESPGTGKGSSATATLASKAKGRKGKKETSAYTRGLLKISPQEAKKDADYYGWMKKKSSNLMTTWKPRLFVLKGRRLAYYYSEDDDHEKGLIDISFHRVLPADNERLTGLHATITGAVGGPGIPAVSTILPIGGDSPALDKGDDTVFIFKLMPPRAGLSRAVNFTKPTVHYFAVPNLQQGRLWMAALMKATIDRDDTQPITSTYQQKTISLAKPKQMRHRPPALMNLEEANEEEHKTQGPKTSNGLGILGESDSGVSGMGRLAGPKIEGSSLSVDIGDKPSALSPQSA
ncbi:Protein BOI2 [Tolypocladium ophioglossoides CBS 100239]|uniref:Protein BOI2 n=1 Tax=Tolypocladium ophioglossoides (strain CBS 100239) TaxID=1163406 RepID=A0A0L0N4E6_TOLOC|nr:Protein BOI2 [Tolypocladium ophioglossoides CBS 100239]